MVHISLDFSSVMQINTDSSEEEAEKKRIEDERLAAEGFPFS